MEKAALQSWIKAQFEIEGERIFNKHPKFLVLDMLAIKNGLPYT